MRHSPRRGRPRARRRLQCSSGPWCAEACAPSRDPGSLLTGKLYIALDFLPASPRVAFDASLQPLELPTVNGTFQELEANIGRMVKKANDLPLDQDRYTFGYGPPGSSWDPETSSTPACCRAPRTLCRPCIARSILPTGPWMRIRPCNEVSRRPCRRPAAPCRPCANWPTISIGIRTRSCAAGDRRRCRRALPRHPRTPTRERLPPTVRSCVARRASASAVRRRRFGITP